MSDAGLAALADVVARARARAAPDPLLVALAGPVAVGKSTLAAALAAHLAATAEHTITVLCTDCFLLPNATLSERGALMRKGFPETFDEEAIAAALRTLKQGRPAGVPVYSHDTYDILEGQAHTVEPADVVIVEGLNLLQPALVPHFDLRFYLDVPEEEIRRWYVERFVGLTRRARSEGGFYAMFTEMLEDDVRNLAQATWDAVNGPNLRDHIEPTRAHADVVVVKGADHTIAGLDSVTRR